MKDIYNLEINGQRFTIFDLENGGKITGDFPRETCPSCNQPNCNRDCDGSQGADETDESDEELVARFQYNATLDAVESMLLALVCNGIDVRKPEYIKVAETILQSAANHLYGIC